MTCLHNLLGALALIAVIAAGCSDDGSDAAPGDSVADDSGDASSSDEPSQTDDTADQDADTEPVAAEDLGDDSATAVEHPGACVEAFDTDGDGTPDSNAVRTFDADGNDILVEHDDDLDGEVDHRDSKTYDPDGNQLTQEATDAGGTVQQRRSSATTSPAT